MRQRTLGILGAALLVGGVVLGIASEIASSRIEPAGAAINRPAPGAIPRHIGPGQGGPFTGDPGRHRFFPGPGPRFPITASPKPPATPTP